MEGEGSPMSDFFDQAKKLASEHEDLVDKGLDKANEMASEKTGGRFDEQIDAGQDKLEGFLGMNTEDDNNQ
jgi:MT0933-like antitoxin protein